MSDQHRPGSITGPIVLRDERGLHELGDRTWVGYGDRTEGSISVAEHAARSIVLVEKQSIFALLARQNVAKENGCVLMAGIGYPGRAFRALACRLHEQLDVPFYVLADNDPAGYELFLLMARGPSGCRAEARSEFAIPSAAYLGLRVRDQAMLGLRENIEIELTDNERQHVQCLQSCAWLRANAAWRDELDTFAERGSKVELEAIVSCADLAGYYLPERLQAGDHLRLPTGS